MDAGLEAARVLGLRVPSGPSPVSRFTHDGATRRPQRRRLASSSRGGRGAGTRTAWLRHALPRCHPTPRTSARSLTRTRYRTSTRVTPACLPSPATHGCCSASAPPLQGQAKALPAMLDAIAALPVRVLLTLGGVLPLSPVDPPPNVTVRGFVPHDLVLPHMAAVISHGGLSTITAALTAGVPLLCIPQGRDQSDNAERVAASGSGVPSLPTHPRSRSRARSGNCWQTRPRSARHAASPTSSPGSAAVTLPRARLQVWPAHAGTDRPARRSARHLCQFRTQGIRALEPRADSKAGRAAWEGCQIEAVTRSRPSIATNEGSS